MMCQLNMQKIGWGHGRDPDLVHDPLGQRPAGGGGEQQPGREHIGIADLEDQIGGQGQPSPSRCERKDCS